MKKDPNKKYNLIIYSSLIFAIISMFIAIKEYYNKLEAKTLSNDFKEAIKEIKEEEPEEELPIIIEEPEKMKDVNKINIINSELENIVERKSHNNLITKEMVLAWGNYEINSVVFKREITEDYYCYLVDIYIYNLDAKLPTEPNEELSTDDYKVLTLYFNIAYNPNNDNYTVKAIEIPNRQNT